MELIRFDAEKAQPLEGGDNVHFVPVVTGEKIMGMLLKFGRNGDTGKREIASDVLFIVISGEGRLRSGGMIADLQQGDVCVLTGGILHHIWTADSEMMAGSRISEVAVG